ncbi:MAG: hypothetical protein ACYCPS_06935, partial [Candidatus Saccharimonadales bacterium]
REVIDRIVFCILADDKDNLRAYEREMSNFFPVKKGGAGTVEEVAGEEIPSRDLRLTSSHFAKLELNESLRDNIAVGDSSLQELLTCLFAVPGLKEFLRSQTAESFSHSLGLLISYKDQKNPIADVVKTVFPTLKWSAKGEISPKDPIHILHDELCERGRTSVYPLFARSQREIMTCRRCHKLSADHNANMTADAEGSAFQNIRNRVSLGLRPCKQCGNTEFYHEIFHVGDPPLIFISPMAIEDNNDIVNAAERVNMSWVPGRDEFSKGQTHVVTEGDSNQLGDVRYSTRAMVLRSFESGVYTSSNYVLVRTGANEWALTNGNKCTRNGPLKELIDPLGTNRLDYIMMVREKGVYDEKGAFAPDPSFRVRDLVMWLYNACAVTMRKGGGVVKMVD